ncbi:MAG TPA: type II toxin-antitoxin system VapC family toxin [Thermoanaerobaculia bacterium]|nr:type II toxin-antitoxin system VapC family toxin [Thermoanaerobaculia bacterium]
MIHLDTSFVVDFLRETSRGEEGSATDLLRTLDRSEIAVSFFVVCELYAGAALAGREVEERARVAGFCAALRVIYPNDGFADAYGRLIGVLRRSGQNTGVMDALIATTALREGARLVTRDRKNFLTVPGLDLIFY